MRKDGAGQRWGSVDEATLRRHDLVQLRTQSAPLVQSFELPIGRPFSVNLTFLSSRPELARVLANGFWMIYQSGRRSATVSGAAEHLKLFHRFLDYRARSQADVRSAKDLNADVLKEFAVWLVAKHHFKRKTAANAFTVCCCFLRSGVGPLAETTS